MNTFTKISATALFALFLTACDKPAEKAAAPAKAENSQTAQQPAPQAETAKAEDAKPTEADQQTLNDFNTLLQWKQEQERKFVSVQQELEQHIATQDKDKLSQALDIFNGKVGEIVKELENLEIKSPEINKFKQKAHENLTLLNGLIVESVKAMQDPKPELQAAIQEKTEVLKKSTLELRQIQTELEQKFLKKQ